ncbi:Mast/stem cell growth factor receptor Kit [Dirofilaria immitis]
MIICSLCIIHSTTVALLIISDFFKNRFNRTAAAATAAAAAADSLMVNFTKIYAPTTTITTMSNTNNNRLKAPNVENCDWWFYGGCIFIPKAHTADFSRYIWLRDTSNETPEIFDIELLPMHIPTECGNYQEHPASAGEQTMLCRKVIRFSELCFQATISHLIS